MLLSRALWPILGLMYNRWGTILFPGRQCLDFFTRFEWDLEVSDLVVNVKECPCQNWCNGTDTNLCYFHIFRALGIDLGWELSVPPDPMKWDLCPVLDVGSCHDKHLALAFHRHGL